MGEHKQYREALLKWCNNISSNWEKVKPKYSSFFDRNYLEEWETSCRDLKEKLQTDLTEDITSYQLAQNLYEHWEHINNAYQEESAAKSERYTEIDEQQQYREDLLEWCNHIYLHWESMKPRFSKLFDIKSLEEWEESCQELKAKLQADLTADFNDYQRAQSLYDHWELLYSEVHGHQEESEVYSDMTTTLS